MGRRRLDEKYAARRGELLDTAWGLLSTEGFAEISLNRFLVLSGVSKGAFYHYFDSWEMLLEDVIDKVARQAVEELASNVGDRHSDPLEELNHFIGISSARPVPSLQLRRLLLQVHAAGDVVLLARLIEKANGLSLPILERIVEDGIANGQFETPYAAEVAEAILSEWNRTLLRFFELLEGNSNPEETTRAILRRTEAAAHITETLLGLERGSIDRTDAADLIR